MSTGRIADQRDALRIDVERPVLALDELHRRADVVYGSREARLARLRQAVVDSEKSVAARRQPRAPIAITVARAELPAAAMHRHQYRRFRGFVRRVKVAQQRYAVMPRIF